MDAFVCIDGRGWEAVTLGAARYLPDGARVTLAHVVDERAPHAYEMSVRGLLGRRRPPADEGMQRASREAAEGLLSDAREALLRQRPGSFVETLILSGDPNKELTRAAGLAGARAMFVGRGTPGARPRETVSGVARDWKRNPDGEFDGLILEDGAEILFPPHRAGAVRAAIGDAVEGGAEIEATGVRRGRRGLHAYSISDPRTGATARAHEAPDEKPGERPLGHTARFVVDHALCDVVVIA